MIMGATSSGPAGGDTGSGGAARRPAGAAPGAVTVTATELRDALMRFSRRLRRERPTYTELNPSHLSALGTLDRGSAMTPSELAASERVQPPSMTRIVARLEELGYVTRVPHPTDGRQAVLSATADGRALLKESRRRRDAWLSQRLRELAPAERDTLAEAARILDRLARS